MLLADLIAHYVYFLRILLIITAVLILISSLDDLFIDIMYWLRIAYKRLVLRRRYKPLDVEQLYITPEAPFAIMVPAWQEEMVIADMVRNTLSTLDYKNYHLFIGVYRNDPATQAKVKETKATYPNVHMVTVPHDGPTNKADCLNWLWQGIVLHETRNDFQFAGIVMHDAEDVVHRLELKLFNHLIERKDMMQLPVFSLESPWFHFTAGHYIDEFAEFHSKDLMVREMLCGAVPSAGVATCFSRRAIQKLAEQRNNLVFNVDSLTEDYDISFRLKALGMKQIFLRYGVMATKRITSPFTKKSRIIRQRDYVATREFFPDSVQAAVRQKARWILGIVFQGWKFIGWQGSFGVRYMLFRDRKSVFAAVVIFIAYFLLINILLLRYIPSFYDKAYLFPPLIEIGSWPWQLMIVNLILLFNRIFHRMYFTGRIYGWEQALLSLPRMVVGNFIAFFASMRAVRLYVAHVIWKQPIVWHKTAHVYPSAAQLGEMRQRLGELLLERNLITQHALQDALKTQRADHRPLGQLLLDKKAISLSDLVEALAQHLGIGKEEALARLNYSDKGKTQ